MFELHRGHLSDLFVLDNIRDGKALQLLKEMGSTTGLASKLRVDLSQGLSNVNESDLQLRTVRYGDNAKIEKAAKGLCHYVKE